MSTLTNELTKHETHTGRAFTALLIAAMTYESAKGGVTLAEFSPRRCAPVSIVELPRGLALPSGDVTEGI